MRLTRFSVQNVRNLKEVTLHCHPQFNIIVGTNGSGKTSLLEAIHLLALGRSFRTRQVHTLITHDAQSLVCFAEVLAENEAKVVMGIEKTREGDVRCKLQGEICSRLSEFASVLPVQLVTPESFRLLTAGAEERRRFLDWGVFHVEHSFASLCQTYHRALKQRNAALKARSLNTEQGVQYWEEAVALTGERIALARGAYLATLEPFIQEACLAWLPNMEISWDYFPGWKEGALGAAIEAARNKDLHFGYTSVGPHRAELEMRVKGYPAHQVLSRGQQKLLMFALLLAQAKQLARQCGKKCVFLIDDLASELDEQNRQRLIDALQKEGHQAFLTAIEASSLAGLASHQHKMFHVEQGEVSCLLEA